MIIVTVNCCLVIVSFTKPVFKSVGERGMLVVYLFACRAKDLTTNIISD